MPAGRLQQVVRCGSPAESAARRLSAWLRLGERSTTCVRGAGELTADAWRARAIGGGTELVAWLAPRDLDGLFTWAGAAADPPARIVLSASLAGEAIDMLPDTLRPRTLVMSEFLEPDRLPSFAARSLVWLNTRGIDRTQSRVAVNALFAATLLGDAMAEPRALASRERLVEQIEHMVGRSAVPSAYPSLTLTSARRFASLGSSVLAVPVTRGGPFSVVGAWAVPDQVEEVP
jgi:hypothetical protein